MSLPSPGQLYLTGKVWLENGRHEEGQQNCLLYDVTVTCRATVQNSQTVLRIFVHTTQTFASPMPDGEYNMSSKVVLSHYLHWHAVDHELFRWWAITQVCLQRVRHMQAKRSACMGKFSMFVRCTTLLNEIGLISLNTDCCIPSHKYQRTPHANSRNRLDYIYKSNITIIFHSPLSITRQWHANRWHRRSMLCQ